MSATVIELLNAKIDALPKNLKGGNVVTADKTATLPQVLDILSKHDIRSVPITDKENGNKLVGVVDMVDIITFIVRFAEECHSLPAHQRNFEWFSEQLQKSGQTIAQIAGLSHKNQLVPLLHGTSIHDIVQVMVQSNVQRVPILNPETNKIENFVTQSALIQYFSKNASKLGRFADCTLGELGFHSKQVVTIKENATAIDAFKLMSTHKITGVPIVDNDGEIITNISSRDLRTSLADPHCFEKLQLPAERFVSELKSKTFLHNAETMYPKICCKFSNKFGETIHKLAATKIHRIYVVDERSHPLGVISLDDIVAKVYELATNNECK